MAVAVKISEVGNEAKIMRPFLMARDNLVDTLKAKRFALFGFDSEETQALRGALEFANARMHSITADLAHPSLTTLAPFDACVVNLSSEVSKVAGGPVDLLAVSRRPTVIIGE